MFIVNIIFAMKEGFFGVLIPELDLRKEWQLKENVHALTFKIGKL